MGALDKHMKAGSVLSVMDGNVPKPLAKSTKAPAIARIYQQLDYVWSVFLA